MASPVSTEMIYCMYLREVCLMLYFLYCIPICFGLKYMLISNVDDTNLLACIASPYMRSDVTESLNP